MSGADLDAVARAVFAGNRQAWSSGRPTRTGGRGRTPVWTPARATRALLVSSPQARHSRNIAARPQISIVVFDSQVPVGSAAAVHMQATAQEVTGAELDRGMAVFAGEARRRACARGPSPTSPRRPKHRLYRATVTEHWVLGPRDERLPGDARLKALEPALDGRQELRRQRAVERAVVPRQAEARSSGGWRSSRCHPRR